MQFKKKLIAIIKPIEAIKLRLNVLFQAIGYAIKSYRLTNKGQLPKYELLQLAHRLEKGLLIEIPKPFWGWEKAYRMAYLISINDDEFSNHTGRGVLKSYLEAKKNSDNPSEKEKAIKFEEQFPDILKEETRGGIVQMTKEKISSVQKELIEEFFKSRHSCRDYQDVLVSKDDIKVAIALAMRCPSACNRQVTNCYVYQSKELQTIILTASIRAYDVGEFNDWFVSPSIFAGYLSLTLHLYGIGSCIYRKQLYGHHEYNELMRKKCNIPNDEMIMLELRFGYYKDGFKVPVSNRYNADDVIKYIDE